MNTFNNLPLYTMTVDGNLQSEAGVDYVALVDRPAIRRSFLAFREDTPKAMAFTVTSEDRRIVSGPLMLADTPIFRNLDEACYVTFPPQAIENIVRKFFCNGNQANVNLMHDPGQKVDGVVMFESFISDPTRGIAPMKGYEDAPAGSWFGSFMVNNDQVWADIKGGAFTGFSVEGLFAQLIPKDAPILQHEDWWNDPELDFTDEQRQQMADLWAIIKKI